MPNTRILIVEDNIGEVNYLTDALTMLDYCVPGAVLSGEDAFVHVFQEPLLDISLIDILLEGDMDGIETADKIHADFVVPIICLTAHDKEGFFQRARMTEPFGFLLKPFSNRELRSTIESFRVTQYLSPRAQFVKSQSPDLRGAPLTVLIADDNDANRTFLKELLSPLGFQIVEAVDGRGETEGLLSSNIALFAGDPAHGAGFSDEADVCISSAIHQ